MKLEKEMLELQENIIDLVGWVRCKGRAIRVYTNLMNDTNSRCGFLSHNVYFVGLGSEV